MKVSALTNPGPVQLNPRAAMLGAENAILSGANTSYYVPDYEGSLSIKSVISGSATWEAGGRRFVVHENSYLILNDRQCYTMTIDSARPVRTFCLFFRRGFVEDAYNSIATPEARLLDLGPEPPTPQLNFLEKLETSLSPLPRLLSRLRSAVFSPSVSSDAIDDSFYHIARAMINEHQNGEMAASRLPAMRASTRQELYRRILRGRDHLLSSLDRPVRLSETAREACLSPYHFHRTFTEFFGETPQRYLTRHRLQKAASMLSATDCSITDVCLESGFESLGSFSTAFHRQFGMSPREFRHRHKFSKMEEVIGPHLE